jgi:hypothetical protein
MEKTLHNYVSEYYSEENTILVKNSLTEIAFLLFEEDKIKKAYTEEVKNRFWLSLESDFLPLPKKVKTMLDFKIFKVKILSRAIAGIRISCEELIPV